MGEREPREPSMEQRHTRGSGVESVLCTRPGRCASEPGGRTVPVQRGGYRAKTTGSATGTAPRALSDPRDKTAHGRGRRGTGGFGIGTPAQSPSVLPADLPRSGSAQGLGVGLLPTLSAYLSLP